MLTIYRRHRITCPHRHEGRVWKRCRCPIWVQGSIDGKTIRESLRIANWERAQARIREWEAEGERSGRDGPVSVPDACREFLADAEARNLQEPTLYKYRLMFKALEAFAEEHGSRFVDDLDLRTLRHFRVTWKDAPITAAKKLERLRASFRYCHESGWIAENPAARIKNPQVPHEPTLPFSRDEIVSILRACDRYPDNYGRMGQANAVRLKALVLLLRYSGLRIGDAVSLRRDRLSGTRLFLYTAKTGTPVFLPLPDFVVKALDTAPATNAEYFFWSGESKKKSAVGDWQRSLRKLFKLAEIEGGHAHRFRDTFAVELLLSGVPLERVSMLLGHRSVKVTERHYSPWVRARQEQLEADVRRTWGEDPIAQSENLGTFQVHEQGDRIN